MVVESLMTVRHCREREEGLDLDEILGSAAIIKIYCESMLIHAHLKRFGYTDWPIFNYFCIKSPD